MAYAENLWTSESGTARNGTVSRYYKCLARKKQNACKKSIVRKDLIERLVIDTTIKILSDNQILNNLADQILVVNKQRINDGSILNVLEKEQTAIQRSINNILKAIENGITTSSTKQRLEELEAGVSIHQS